MDILKDKLNLNKEKVISDPSVIYKNAYKEDKKNDSFILHAGPYKEASKKHASVKSLVSES